MKKISEQEASRILEERQVPDDVKIKSAPFTLFTEIDGRPQPLRKLRPFLAPSPVPGDLTQPAQDVMKLLFVCFDRQGYVSEGLIGDVMFGFETSGLPYEYTLLGLSDLKKSGYIDFQAKDGSYIDTSSDKITSAWVRYTKKMLDLVYS